MIDASQLQFFDPQEDFTILERRLPHWSQTGTLAFITWRTEDSMPEHVIDDWNEQRVAWLREQGINICHQRQVNEVIRKQTAKLQQQFHTFSDNHWHLSLDDGHGACVLRYREITNIVSKSLLHFDGDRYLLTDFVIMPNHVHLLVAFPDESSQLQQCESWKHYTATLINRHFKKQGRFWRQDCFDHLIRSEKQFQHLRQYVRNNPIRARLKAGEFLHYSKLLSGDVVV